MTSVSFSPQKGTTPPRADSLWRNRNFVLLWGGQAISALGTSTSDVAFQLLVLALTHDAAQVAFIASVRALPYLIITLPAGALMDRWDRKRVMLLCDLGRTACLASIALPLLLGHPMLLQLYVVALLEGSLATLYTIAALAGISHVVAKEQLAEASSAAYVSGATARLVGPSIGAWLYTVASAVPFLVDALSYLASVASLAWIRVNFQERRDKRKGPDGPSQLRALGKDLTMGFTWMWRQPVLRFQALGGCVLTLALYPTGPLAIALAARLHAPQASIGVIFSLGAVGGLVGGFVGPWFQRRAPFGSIMIAMFAALAILFTGYLVAPNVVWLGILFAAIALVESIGSIANFTYRLALTPDEYQGRVNSIHRFVGFGIGRPLGAALLGILLVHAGVQTAVFVFCGVLAFFALATALYTPVRALPRLGRDA